MFVKQSDLDLGQLQSKAGIICTLLCISVPRFIMKRAKHSLVIMVYISCISYVAGFFNIPIQVLTLFTVYSKILDPSIVQWNLTNNLKMILMPNHPTLHSEGSFPSPSMSRMQCIPIVFMRHRSLSVILSSHIYGTFHRSDLIYIGHDLRTDEIDIDRP